MKLKTTILLIIICLSFSSFAQISIIIDTYTETTPQEGPIYMAGSMNDWNPGDNDYLFYRNTEGHWQLFLDAQPEGTEIEFKFTRGDWSTVEKGPNGEEMSNRTLIYGNGEFFHYEIHHWADGGTGGLSTATENVHIINEEFYMPQLERYRRIWIYLPPDYDTTTNSYPVIYMQDGQNLFNLYTSFSGEWEIDETLNELYEEGIKVPIVVGIDNGGANRIDEYSPWVNPSHGGGQGNAYINFIAETLKPYIDSHYRTLKDKYSTGIMGSSMGGLISFYGVFERHDVFGKAGLFSPSYWFSDSVWLFQEQQSCEAHMLYSYVGASESPVMYDNVAEMGNRLNGMGCLSSWITVGGGLHNEYYWGSYFDRAYEWLFASYISGIGESLPLEDGIIYPNPVIDSFRIEYKNIEEVYIYNLKGELISISKYSEGALLDISRFESGIYILKLIANDAEVYTRLIKM